MNAAWPSSPDPAASRRHHIAILFSDLSDSTRIAASMEPEHYAEMLQRLRAMLDTVVTRHGGEIARIDGDGALCIFGYPHSHEDAGRRAVEAALDLHAAAAALGEGLATGGLFRMHSGIHAGVVLLRDGDMVRGRFELLGDPTNIAARLCDHAAAGEIIVSAATLGADRHFFRTGAPRRVEVAGRTEPIAVLAVAGREAATTRLAARTPAGLTPFAGRAAELARLRAWLERGQTGRATALIAGPPGIGKTRLLDEFLTVAAARGITVHRGYCEAYLGAPPLQPFAQVAASIGGTVPTSLVDPEGQALGPKIDAMRALWDRAAAQGPCIVAIDDWQWADDASREMLDALVADSDARIRILLVSRAADARLRDTEPSEIILMPPLSPGEAQAAIVALLPIPDGFLATRIREAAGGSPLFLEELCHASGRVEGGTDGAEPSAWLDMLIQARFAALPPDQAALVRAAAVIGPIVPTGLFTAMTGVAGDDAALTALAAADFIYPGNVDGTLRFKHGITRDAIYRTIGLRERRMLHRRVVDALNDEAQGGGGPPKLDALAYHHAAGGNIDQAIPFAIRAGDAALAAGALDRAQAQYRTAFEGLAAKPDDHDAAIPIWKLVNKYGLACIFDPSPDQLPVLHAMAERLQALGNAEALVRSQYWIGVIAYGLGDGRRSVAHLEAAARTATATGRDRLLPQIEIKLAQSRFAAGDYARANALFVRVLDVIRRSDGRNDREALIYAVCCHGFLRADQGDFAAAELCYAEAEAVLGSDAPPLHASYLTQKSAICLMRGQWAEAIVHAERCLIACGKTRARYQATMAHALAAYARWQIDRDPRAVDALIGAARWFAAGASQQRTSLVYGWLADIMEHTGQPELARHYAGQALLRVRRSGDRLGEAMAYRAMARLAAAGRTRHSPAHYLTRADRSAVIRRSPREQAQNLLCAGELALDAGKRDRALPLLAAAHDAFAALDMASFVSRAAALVSASR